MSRRLKSSWDGAFWRLDSSVQQDRPGLWPGVVPGIRRSGAVQVCGRRRAESCRWRLAAREIDDFLHSCSTTARRSPRPGSRLLWEPLESVAVCRAGAWRWMRSEGSHSERESPSCGQGGEGGPDLILASRNQVPLKDPKRDTAKTAGTSGHGRRGRAHEMKRISLIWV